MKSHLIDVQTKRDDAAWEITIEAKVPAERVEEFRTKVLSDLQKEVRMDGFRPGKVPLDRVKEAVGEQAILERAAERAVREELPILLAEEKSLIVDAPKVSINPPLAGSPVSFSARAPLAPEIKLPEYKKISEKHTKAAVPETTDDELKEVLTHLKRERARIEGVEKGQTAQEAAESAKKMEEKDLPELDAPFAQTLGYESAESFIDTVRSNIKTEKQMRETEKHRAAIIDTLLKGATVKYPKMLLEYELDDMESRFTMDLERVGTNMEGYLKETKKTKEDLRKEWHDAADKRARTRLILAEIARQEKIEPEQSHLEHELDHAMQHYPNANREALRSHVAHAMRNEQVIRMLEGNPEPVGHTAHHHTHDH